MGTLLIVAGVIGVVIVGFVVWVLCAASAHGDDVLGDR